MPRKRYPSDPAAVKKLVDMLDRRVANRADDLNGATTHIARLHDQITRQNAAYKNLGEKVDGLLEEMRQKDERITDLEKKRQAVSFTAETLASEVTSKGQKVSDLKAEIERMERAIAGLKGRNEAYKDAIYQSSRGLAEGITG